MSGRVFGHTVGVVRWLLSIGVVAGLLLAIPTASAVPTSGLRGLVKKGPITPVCSAGRPCSARAPNVTLVFSRRGFITVRATTDGKGKYRVTLRPGAYTVQVKASAMPIGRGLSPRIVHVIASEYSRQDFMLDTGIR